ncbi:MFS transporter [Sporolactobacillus terrae]|uniref:MFS transporter n=1 Tax=Sporolactobacillus terrae TaxID=269673 RepID=UPI000490EC63|nr:MFS transporter [Sporolactobacillus terrae]
MFSLLKRKRAYCKLFFSGLINGIGDRFCQVAMLTMLLTLTNSGFSVGFVMLLRLIPFLIFAPIGGRLSDRFSRKHLMVATDLARVLFALSFLFAHTKSDVWIIYLSAFILAVGEAIYSPTRMSLIPFSVSKSSYSKVNSMEQVLSGIVLIVGAFAGGIVSFIFGVAVAFWLNGMSFLASAFINATLKINDSVTKPPVVNVRRPAPFHRIKEVLTHSFLIKFTLLYIVLISLVTGIDNLLISIYAVQLYHLGNLGVGFFYGALGIGLVSSYSITRHLKNHFIVIGLLCLSLEGMMLVLLSFSANAISAFIIFCFTALFSGTCNACFNTILMNAVPPEIRGSFFGIIQALSNALLAASMFVAGTCVDLVTPRILGRLGGLVFVFISFILMILFAFHGKKMKENNRREDTLH